MTAHALKIVPERTPVPARLPHPTKLFAEVTTRCNLRCSMCIKQAPGNEIVEGHMSADTFARLAPAFPRLEALVLNGIGEPLLHPKLEQFIATARRAMPAAGWIGFQTNGQLLDARRARSLVEAGVDRICVSSDAVSPETFRRMREGGCLEGVQGALAALHAAARQRGRAISVGLEFVAAKDNVHELPQLVRWAAQNHVAFVIVTHMLPYQEGLAQNAAYDTSTDGARELFDEWSRRAAADGVRLDRYFDLFMRFKLAPEDQRVVDYVNRMVAEGASRGIAIHLARLLQHDRETQRRVAESFAAAEELARRHGIELQLPNLVPTRARRCEFVEDGGAFVSWDGKLHPCYFLWHGYRCHAGGIAKRVEPKAFGSVLENDVLDLWNARAARTFRDGVLKYDFPFCYDCSVALCDYVDGSTEFTQDCHSTDVPCASCLWCTGLFRCLQ
jgi:putative metalloenzyme radical SAM/SPASM domain maturase